MFCQSAVGGRKRGGLEWVGVVQGVDLDVVVESSGTRDPSTTNQGVVPPTTLQRSGSTRTSVDSIVVTPLTASAALHQRTFPTGSSYRNLSWAHLNSTRSGLAHP